MRGRNISDVIEQYLKRILANDSRIEISRSSIANLFNVVPSQINYVIKTRFTIPNGYLVNSKRGGGGYIRIKRVKLLNNFGILDTLINAVGNHLSQKSGEAVIHTLRHGAFLDKKEADLILTVINRRTLRLDDPRLESRIRAQILVSILNRLKYES